MNKNIHKKRKKKRPANRALFAFFLCYFRRAGCNGICYFCLTILFPRTAREPGSFVMTPILSGFIRGLSM